MTFLPIVARELRVAARRVSTVRGRVMACAWGMLAGTFCFSVNSVGPQTTLGSYLFVTFASVLSIYCFVAGVQITQDCISSEKRDGTLGLLFLTDLKGYDVVFGKLAATSLNSAYQVLGVFPLLGIPFLLGGIDLATFGRFLLAVCNLMFFSLATGMLGSALCVRERQSSYLATLVLVGTSLVPVVIGVTMAFRRNINFDNRWLATTPWYACYTALVSPRGIRRGPMFNDSYLVSLAVGQAYSWVFLIVACYLTPRSWQQRETGRARRFLSRWNERFGVSLTARLAWRRKCLDHNPILWLVTRHGRENTAVLVFLTILSLGYATGFVRFGLSIWFNVATSVMFALICQSVVKVWAARQAAHHFAEDRREGAMELLMNTPLSIGDVVAGNWAGLRRVMALPLLILFVFEFFLYWIARREGESEWTEVYLANLLVVAVDLWAMIWISMDAALTLASSTRSAARAIRLVMITPWVLFTGLGMITEGFNGAFFGSDVLIWALCSLFIDGFFGIRARQRVMNRFREMVAQPIDSKGGTLRLRLPWKRHRSHGDTLPGAA